MKSHDISYSQLPDGKHLYRVDNRRATQDQVDDLKRKGRLDCFHTAKHKGQFTHYCRVTIK